MNNQVKLKLLRTDFFFKKRTMWSFHNFNSKVKNKILDGCDGF